MKRILSRFIAISRPLTIILSLLLLFVPSRFMKKLSPKWRKRVNLAAITIILVFLPLAIWQMFFTTDSAEAAWWNDNWLYRKEIPVSAHTSAEKDVSTWI